MAGRATVYLRRARTTASSTRPRSTALEPIWQTVLGADDLRALDALFARLIWIADGEIDALDARRARLPRDHRRRPTRDERRRRRPASGDRPAPATATPAPAEAHGRRRRRPAEAGEARADARGSLAEALEQALAHARAGQLEQLDARRRPAGAARRGRPRRRPRPRRAARRRDRRAVRAGCPTAASTARRSPTRSRTPAATPPGCARRSPLGTRTIDKRTPGGRFDGRAYARGQAQRAARPAGQHAPVADHPPGPRADPGAARRAGHRHLRLDGRLRVRARPDRLDPHRRAAPDRRALRDRAVRRRRRAAHRRRATGCALVPGIRTGGGTAFAGDAIVLASDAARDDQPAPPALRLRALSDGGWYDTHAGVERIRWLAEPRRPDDPHRDRLRAAVGRGRPDRRDHRPRRRARPDRRRHRRRAARRRRPPRAAERAHDAAAAAALDARTRSEPTERTPPCTSSRSSWPSTPTTRPAPGASPTGLRDQRACTSTPPRRLSRRAPAVATFDLLVYADGIELPSRRAALNAHATRPPPGTARGASDSVAAAERHRGEKLGPSSARGPARDAAAPARAHGLRRGGGPSGPPGPRDERERRPACREDHGTACAEEPGGYTNPAERDDSATSSTAGTVPSSARAGPRRASYVHDGVRDLARIRRRTPPPVAAGRTAPRPHPPRTRQAPAALPRPSPERHSCQTSHPPPHRRPRCSTSPRIAPADPAGTLVRVALDELELAPNARREIAPEGIERLARMLMTHGPARALHRPPPRRPDRSSLYAGQRRLLAARASHELAGDGLHAGAQPDRAAARPRAHRRRDPPHPGPGEPARGPHARRPAGAVRRLLGRPRRPARDATGSPPSAPTSASAPSRPTTCAASSRSRSRSAPASPNGPAERQLSVTLANRLADMHDVAPELTEAVAAADLHRRPARRRAARPRRLRAPHRSSRTRPPTPCGSTTAPCSTPHTQLDARPRAPHAPPARGRPPACSAARPTSSTPSSTRCRPRASAGARDAARRRRAARPRPHRPLRLRARPRPRLRRRHLGRRPRVHARRRPPGARADTTTRPPRPTRRYFAGAGLDDARPARRRRRTSASAATSSASARPRPSRTNLGLGHDLRAGLIDPSPAQLDALRAIVCHLLARDYRDVIAYGAGWTDPERQRPVGETGRHEPQADRRDRRRRTASARSPSPTRCAASPRSSRAAPPRSCSTPTASRAPRCSAASA